MKKHHFLLLIIMLLAAFFRFRFDNQVNFLLIGADGPYYALQVRSLLENGRLALPDMPLVFVLEAILAKILYTFGIFDFEKSIEWAFKLVDVLIPPLAVIPVFLTTRFFAKGEKINWQSWLLIVFSVVNFTVVIYFMHSGLQKNAVAVVLAFSFLFSYLLTFFNAENQQTNTFFSDNKKWIFLVLCALTHFGTFSVLLFFLVLHFIFKTIFEKKENIFLNKKTFLSFGLAATISLMVLYLFDNQRFERLMILPTKIFQGPVFMFLADGQTNILPPMVLIHVFAFHILVIFAAIVFYTFRKKINVWEKSLGVTLMIMILCLASPLLGLEWSNRLYNMTYIPIVILFLLIFSFDISKWWKLLPSLIFSGLMMIALIFGAFENRAVSISKEAFSELSGLRNVFPANEKSLIIGRQDLRLLASWVFHCKNSSEYYFQKEELKNYDAVYFLYQTNGNFLNSPRHAQKPIPRNSQQVFKGNFFEIYQIQDSTEWQEGRNKPMTTKGKIIDINGNTVTVKNEKTGVTRQFYFSEKTVFESRNNEKTLQKDQNVCVWGKWKVFSLAVEAEIILIE